MVANEIKTDSAVKKEGMDALFDKLGMVDAERFITLVIKEPFDYTLWQKDLYNNLDVDTLGKMAYEYCNK